MNNGRGKTESQALAFLSELTVRQERASGGLHPAWRAFLTYCAEMGHGEIERLKIQDGLPVLAEVATKKVKF